MTLLKDNDYKEINVALLSLEADIKNKITNFDTSVIDRQLAEINSRIDKINAGGGNSSAAINDIRTEIEDINSKVNGNSAKIENIEQKLSDIFSAENKVTDFNTTIDSGIYYWVNDAANRPSDYGVLLVNKYDGGDSASNLWINQVAYGTNNKIYFRQNINSGSWTEWKAVVFAGEKVSTAGTADVANAIANRGGITNTDTFQNVMNNDGKWRITDLSSGWNGSLYSFHAGGSQSGLMFRIRGGSTNIRNVEVNYSIDSNRFAGPWTPLIGRIPIGAPSSPQDGDIWIEG